MKFFFNLILFYFNKAIMELLSFKLDDRYLLLNDIIQDINVLHLHRIML